MLTSLCSLSRSRAISSREMDRSVYAHAQPFRVVAHTVNHHDTYANDDEQRANERQRAHGTVTKTIFCLIQGGFIPCRVRCSCDMPPGIRSCIYSPSVALFLLRRSNFITAQIAPRTPRRHSRHPAPKDEKAYRGAVRRSLCAPAQESTRTPRRRITIAACQKWMIAPQRRARGISISHSIAAVRPAYTSASSVSPCPAVSRSGCMVISASRARHGAGRWHPNSSARLPGLRRLACLHPITAL